MPRVIHFEIPSKEPEKLAEFYKKVFNWEIKKWEGPMPYWLITTGPESEPGINGAIYEPDKQGIHGVVNTVQVTGLEDYIEKVKASGGESLTDIMEIPNVGRFLYCKDSQGNLFGMMEPKV
jgi:uncharacterized protein